MSGDAAGGFAWSTAAALVGDVRRAVGVGAALRPEFDVEGGTGLAAALAVPELAVGAVAAQLLAAGN